MWLLIALQFFQLSATAFGSDCVGVQDPHPSAEKIKIERQRAFQTSPAVFKAKVIGLDGQHVRLQVTKVWSGVPPGELVMNTGYKKGPDGTYLNLDCHYEFKVDEEYLVYAKGEPGQMEALTCLTKTIKEAASDEESELDRIREEDKQRLYDKMRDNE